MMGDTLTHTCTKMRLLVKSVPVSECRAVASKRRVLGSLSFSATELTLGRWSTLKVGHIFEDARDGIQIGPVPGGMGHPKLPVLEVP